MAVEGAIADEARGHLGVTWSYLSKDSVRYGDTFLQRKVDNAKNQIFGEVVDPDDEETLYAREVIEYAGKAAALKIIPGAADYWASQKVVDSSGQKENATWVDRVEAIWKLRDRLKAEVEEDKKFLSDLHGSVIAVRPRRRSVGVTVGINDTYLTPNVEDVPRQAAIPDRTAVV